MSLKSTIVVSIAGLVLVGCACENNSPAPPDDVPVETGVAPTEGMIVDEPNPTALPPPVSGAVPVDGPATLVAPNSAVAGANITLTWTGPGNDGDYVDLVPRGYSQTQGEIAYVFVRGTNGTAVVRAPTAAGDYDLRYVLDMGGPRSVKATAPLTVTAADAALTAPARVETGQAFSVAWTGPNGAGDYIDIAKAGETLPSGEITYAWTSAGTPAKLEAPSAPGAYVVRYILEGPTGRKITASVPLAVELAKATLKAPASVAKGAKFKVEWTGPKSSGDYVDLVPKGSTATSGEKSYFYLTAEPELTAPAEPGDYEVRYVLEAPGGRAILTRIALRVQ